MAATRASIICYYDLISPYTYMGFKLFNRFRKQWPAVDVTFKPILLGGIMNVRLCGLLSHHGESRFCNMKILGGGFPWFNKLFMIFSLVHVYPSYRLSKTSRCSTFHPREIIW